MSSFCNRLKSVRNHRMCVLCAVTAKRPYYTHTVLCFRINRNDRVLIAPGVAHSVAHTKWQWLELNFRPTRWTQLCKPASHTLAKRKSRLLWQVSASIVNLAVVALHSRLQCGGNLLHLGEAFVIRILHGHAALKVREPHGRTARMTPPLSQQRLSQSYCLTLRIRVLGNA